MNNKTTIKPRTSNYYTTTDKSKVSIRKAIVITTAKKKVYKEIIK